MAVILLVEDSPLQQLCLSRQLQALGHAIVCVSDCEQALAAVGLESVDLVLVQVLMAADNGFEIGLQLLQAGVSGVLLYSSVYRETDEHWARALGLSGVLTVPIGQSALGDRVSRLLAASGNSRPGTTL